MQLPEEAIAWHQLVLGNDPEKKSVLPPSPAWGLRASRDNRREVILTVFLVRGMLTHAARSAQAIDARSFGNTPETRLAHNAARNCDTHPEHRWRRRAAMASVLIVIGLLAALARSEFYPADLAEAEASYRRDDLRTALRLAEGHLRRPFNRQAAVLAARCLSRLGQPDQAETHYQKAGHLDFEDQHIRAFGLVVNNRREPAIQAHREILECRPNDVLALSRMAGVLVSESAGTMHWRHPHA